MIRLMVAIAIPLVLAACGSTVKLDKVPVEDRVATSVQQSGAGGAADSIVVTQTGVTPLHIDGANSSTNANADAAVATVARVVYFDYDSFAIRPEFQALIEANGRLLKADKARQVAIEGHTDERGGREYNLALGQKRAETVRAALGVQGVADSQMEAVSFGKEKPAVPGLTETAMEKNRRAEIVYR
jgi:peptidoglycan-associated lipoprotein